MSKNRWQVPLGVMMFSAELGSTKSTDLQGGFYYREYSYGNATSDDDGVIIELYTSPAWFPVFERRLVTKKVSRLQYQADSVQVAFNVREGSYDLSIWTNDGFQFDTLISR